MISVGIAIHQKERKDAFALRKDVFIVEQNVPKDLELDEFDKDAIHVVAKKNNKVVGTGRMVLEKNRGRIGRIAVEKEKRKKGIGKQLMLSLEQEAQKRNLREIYLHAQLNAKLFYEKLGYQPRGEVFNEAGIDHIEMYKTLTK